MCVCVCVCVCNTYIHIYIYMYNLFPMMLILYEMQAASFRIWTLDTGSISYNNNHRTMNASEYMCLYMCLYTRTYACVRTRQSEWERERERERERESKCVCVHARERDRQRETETETERQREISPSKVHFVTLDRNKLLNWVKYLEKHSQISILEMSLEIIFIWLNFHKCSNENLISCSLTFRDLSTDLQNRGCYQF